MCFSVDNSTMFFCFPPICALSGAILALCPRSSTSAGFYSSTLKVKIRCCLFYIITRQFMSSCTLIILIQRLIVGLSISIDIIFSLHKSKNLIPDLRLSSLIVMISHILVWFWVWWFWVSGKHHQASGVRQRQKAIRYNSLRQHFLSYFFSFLFCFFSFLFSFL